MQRRLRELVQFRSSDCFSSTHPPCPRRPTPDTASTFALAQGQQEGDKRRARAQAHAQVPDAAPTPVNHTSRTRQPLHCGLPLRFYFGTRCRSLLIFCHYRNTGDVVSCIGRCNWGILEHQDFSQSWLASLTKANPCRRSPNLGRIAVILRASKPRERHRLLRGKTKRLCARCGSHAKGERPCPAGQPPPHH